MVFTICFHGLQPSQFPVRAAPWYVYSASSYDTQDFFLRFCKHPCGSRNSV